MKDLKEFGKKYIFLPDATRGVVRYLTSKQLEETGTEGIVVNTLHLMISPGSEKIKELGGIHNFMKWSGYVLSDSGGFQVFSLIHSKKWKGKIDENGATFKSPRDGSVYELTPEKSIDTQINIGSDILVALDDCRDAELKRKDAEESVQRTLEWAERCKVHFEKEYGGTKKTGKLLTAVVQGANYPDLRKRCAEDLVKIGFDGYNFGGYVVDDKGKLVLDEMKVVSENTPDDKFRYAMGVGKPEDIRRAAKIGYMIFDTVLVTRNARHGTLYSSDMKDEILRIGNSEYSNDLRSIDSKCDCEACRNYSRAYIHHMLKVDEATAKTLCTIHNLRYYQNLIGELNKVAR